VLYCLVIINLPHKFHLFFPLFFSKEQTICSKPWALFVVNEIYIIQRILCMDVPFNLGAECFNGQQFDRNVYCLVNDQPPPQIHFSLFFYKRHIPHLVYFLPKAKAL
jgi:hypothetical protein